MDFNEAKIRHEELVRIIEKYSYEYYVLDNPSVSDQEYDQKYEELENLEKEFPELITKTSPTQRIGNTVLEGFTKISPVPPFIAIESFSFICCIVCLIPTTAGISCVLAIIAI